MSRFQVTHTTVYNYRTAVMFGQHRLMLRPRDSHELRLIDATLAITPTATLRWIYDVHGNSICKATFEESASELRIVSNLEIERYAGLAGSFPVDPEAAIFPFIYSANDRADLGRLDECHYPDPRRRVREFGRSFVCQRRMRTLDLLSAINDGIHSQLTYRPRYSEGTQTPTETLASMSGTCRDYATLMIETARSLGFGARFVTGYLHDPKTDNGQSGLSGGQDTHAWVEIYIPGAGWIEYDPTNGFLASEYLIRVAVTRDASQAAPISGSFIGAVDDYLGMSVAVTVRSVAGATV